MTVDLTQRMKTALLMAPKQFGVDEPARFIPTDTPPATVSAMTKRGLILEGGQLTETGESERLKLRGEETE